MIVSQTCKYGLRAVIYLARHESTPVLSKQIAEDLDIPQPFLVKTLRNLCAGGLLQSSKGKRGGFKLARPAETIRLLDVVEWIDRSDFAQACALGPDCSELATCLFHSQWSTIIRMLGEKGIKELLEEDLPCPWLESTPEQ